MFLKLIYFSIVSTILFNLLLELWNVWLISYNWFNILLVLSTFLMSDSLNNFGLDILDFYSFISCIKLFNFSLETILAISLSFNLFVSNSW